MTKAQGREDFGTEAEIPKPRKKKRVVAIAVLAVIAIAAGVGFTIWHEQPSFCNAICHSPMDPYVEGFYSENENSLAVAHRVADVACLDCHEPTLTQQIGEGIAWATGNYYVPLEQRDLATESFCLNEACHVEVDIIEATTDWGGEGFNPHENHMSRDLECGDCHSVHHESTLYCNDCHYADLPEG